MKLVFSVRDRKAQVFNRPFFEVNKVQAQRAFETAVKDVNSPFHAYPDDFEMCYMGEFDETTGKFVMLGFPEVLCSARDFLMSAPNSSVGVESVSSLAKSIKSGAAKSAR